MEIKTCEEYVLAELDRVQKELELAKEEAKRLKRVLEEYRNDPIWAYLREKGMKPDISISANAVADPFGEQKHAAIIKDMKIGSWTVGKAYAKEE